MKKKYRYIGGNFYNITEGKVIYFDSSRDRIFVYPTGAVQALISCTDFKTLDEHTQAYLLKRQTQIVIRQTHSLIQKCIKILTSKLIEFGIEVPILKQEFQTVKKQLNTFVKNGILVAQDDVFISVITTVSDYKIKSGTSERIQIMGIPTRNRKELLTRCIHSYLENFKQNNRECSFYIADDSDYDVPESRRVTEELCERFGVNILWADRMYRQTFANSITKISEVPETITRFSLVGDKRCDLRTGACRNTLLLLAAGQPSIQVDDDTICGILPSPQVREGMAISSEMDCNQYQFYDNRESVIEQQSATLNRDFFAVHEELLGKQAVEIIRERVCLNTDSTGDVSSPNFTHLNTDRMEAGLFEKLSQPDMRVAVSYTGALGDSGLSCHWWRLFFLNGDSFTHLANDEQTYFNSIRSRLQLRVTSQVTISDGPFYMPMNIGLDTRRLLPPFTPVQRNQDGPFSQLLFMGFKEVCRGYSPYAILHEPQGRPALEDRSKMLAVGPYRMPDILDAIIWSLSQWPFGSNPAKNIQTVGQYLLDLSQLPTNHFKIDVHRICLHTIQKRIGYIQHCIEERFDAPEYWHKDAQQVLVNFQELMQQENLCIPCDLPGSAQERLALFQELVGKFGQVLIHWPAMWDAAVEINRKRKMEGVDVARV